MTLFVTRVNQTRTESYPLFLDLNNCLKVENGGGKRKEGDEKQSSTSFPSRRLITY